MNQLLIHLSAESYKTSDFGDFFVQLGDFYFPSKGWTDFGERVVFDWLNKLTDFFFKQNEKVGCKFMDGNYRFDIESTESSTQLYFKFIREKRDSDEIEYQERVDTEQFVQEVLRVVKEIQSNCKIEENYDAVKRIEESVKNFLKAKDHFVNI